MTPENRFIQNIHKRLKQGIYREKTHNSFRGGTPDVFYEGKASMFWVEYKFLSVRPKKAFTPKLSELQKRWLKRNYENGFDPLVIVGFPKGGVILQTPYVWENQVPVGKADMYSYDGIAEYLFEKAHYG